MISCRLALIYGEIVSGVRSQVASGASIIPSGGTASVNIAVVRLSDTATLYKDGVVVKFRIYFL